MTSSFYFKTVDTLGEGRFRLTWLGDIVRSSYTVNFNAIFSPMAIDPSTGEEICNTAVHRSTPLPVAYLRQFRIGDVWQQGQKTDTWLCESQETFALDLAKENITIAPAGLPHIADSGTSEYLLPFSSFDAHRDHTKSQCARIPLADGSILVIPCMELIRFYFGASGAFLKHLFSGALAIDQLYSDARYNAKTGAANLQLSPHLPGVAATTVARIAFSAQAKSAARWIVNSGVAASANQTSYYPKTTFPFYGQTHLTARGRWIQTGTRRVFLAEQLLQCTHPFPFSSLYYTTQRSISQPPRQASSPQPAMGYQDHDSSEQASTQTALTNAPSAYILQAIGVQIEESAQSSFPDLERKKIRRVGHSPHKSSGSSAAMPPELGAGDPRGDSFVREAELAADLAEVSLDVPPPEAAEILEKAVTINRGTGLTHMEWKSISKPAHRTSQPYESFMRGDTVFRDSKEEKLQDIWVGMLEVGISEIRLPVLLLVRDNIPEDMEDHIVFFHLDPDDSYDAIQGYCEKFARHDKDEPQTSRVISSIESQRSSDLMAILRNLSMVITYGLRRNSQ